MIRRVRTEVSRRARSAPLMDAARVLLATIHPALMFHRSVLVLLAAFPLACGEEAKESAPIIRAAPDSAARARVPNEMGFVPILEYHIVGDKEGRWERERGRFREDLALLYARGYRPVSVSQLIDRSLDLPYGISPVVITFDDASPSQFRYVERDSTLEVDSTSALGIWLDFRASHPDWGNHAVFCLLADAEAGRSFFGKKGIEGQRTEWRHRKLRFLAEQGFELCNHTLWHAQLDRYPDDFVQEHIARAQMAIDSAVPGYRVRSFALPLGRWPKNRDLAAAGSWTDPRSGRTITYRFDAILEVAGGPNVSPYDSTFSPLKLKRWQVLDDELRVLLDRLDARKTRFISDGDTSRIAGRPLRQLAPISGTAPVPIR